MRAALLDAERWLARWEIDAVFSETVGGARMLFESARRAWESHCELCQVFAEWARPIVEHHARTMREFGGLRR